MRATLSLVKPLSHLKEEQRTLDEISLESFGLSLIRGTVSEIAGPASTGKMSVAIALLAQLTSVGETCAVVDSVNGFDPVTAKLAGVELSNLLWVRCSGDIEKSFMAADYLLQAKGFGAMWLNLCGLPVNKLRAVPRTYWFRYRTRIKDTPTLMLVTSNEFLTGSASQQSFVFKRERAEWSGHGNFKLLDSLHTRIVSRKRFFGPPIEAFIKADYTDV
ncbi:MAG: hypothetical protein JO314_09200 [Acidobacteria bacterium]|nr:hypothetical protein [Acidobacteriota bacterium]